MSESALTDTEIGYLDFELVCGCREREVLSGKRFFGIIAPKMGKFKKCGQVARYSAVSRCCGEQVLLCRGHRIGKRGWICLRCRSTSESIDGALVIYAL